MAENECKCYNYVRGGVVVHNISAYHSCVSVSVAMRSEGVGVDSCLAVRARCSNGGSGSSEVCLPTKNKI